MSGHFTLNGSKFSGDVLQMFRDGVKATPKASLLLSKWAKEADDQAEKNNQAWDEFNRLNPSGIY